MACQLPPSLRDILVRLFRQTVYRRAGYVEFPHQAAWRLATEGMEWTPEPCEEPSEAIQLAPLTFDPAADYSLKPTPIKTMIPCLPTERGAFAVEETGNYARYQWTLAVPRQAFIRKVLETGVVAHHASDMSSFKGGKSKSAGMWSAGFACLPGATVDMIGIEYASSEHEFNYLIEALLAGKDAPVKKTRHFYNDVRAGRMYLELLNECSFAARSWGNKETIRGGQITAYLYNEAYQLPGLEVHTGIAQNLRRERGFALWTTTPDRPWVEVLHRMGHGKNADWFCVCGSTGYVNPFVFDLSAFMADLPDWQTLVEYAPEMVSLCLESGYDPGALMSKEKFLISHLGKMGEFVGRVYQFQQGAMTVTPTTHSAIWKPSVVLRWMATQLALSQLREQEKTHGTAPHAHRL